MDLCGCSEIWFNGNILWELSPLAKVKWYGWYGMRFNDKLNPQFLVLL